MLRSVERHRWEASAIGWQLLVNTGPVNPGSKSLRPLLEGDKRRMRGPRISLVFKRYGTLSNGRGSMTVVEGNFQERREEDAVWGWR